MAAPGLIALLNDQDETVRCQSAQALGQLAGEAAFEGAKRLRWLVRKEK